MIGFLLPPFIDGVNRYIPSSRGRAVVSFLICIGIGIVVNLNKLYYASPEQIMQSVAVIIASSQMTYNLIYKDTKLQDKIRGEDNTSGTDHKL